MPYGIIKVDTVTFTNDGVDKSVTLSGLVRNPTFSGNVTVTGTFSGVTVTGTTANFTSGNFTNISGGTHTITSGVFAAGSAASPSITFTGDLNTGIYSPGADQVAISTGGSGRLFVDASGNVGITESSPSSYSAGAGIPNLVLKGSSATFPARSGAIALLSQDTTTAKTWIYHDTDFYIQNTTATNIRFLTNNAERLRITSAGLVGIGTSSPVVDLDVGPAASTATFRIHARSNTTPVVAIELVRGTNTTFGADGNGDYRIKNDTGNLSFEYGDTGVTTERARIDSSGRLLVGTSSSVFGSLVQSASTGGAQYEGSRFSADSFGPAFTFIKSRGASIGTNAAVQQDDILGIINFRGANGSDYSNTGAQILAQVDGAVSGGGANDMPGRLVFSTTADGASSPTERMRIDNVGRSFFGTAGLISGFYPAQVVISATNATEGLDIHGTNSTGTNLSIWAAYAGSGTLAAFWAGTPRSFIGGITHNGTSVSYGTSSDYRLKENVTSVTDGIARLQQLKPSRFNFIAAPDKTVDGFIAHEVQTIVPEAVTGEKDAVDDDGNPVYQGIDQSKLVPLLTAALQEAIGEIESLKARLTAAGI